MPCHRTHFEAKYFLAAQQNWEKAPKVVNEKSFVSSDFHFCSNIFEFVSLYFSRVTCDAKWITTNKEKNQRKTFMKIQWYWLSFLLFAITSATADDEYECNSNANQTSCKIKKIIRTRILRFTNVCERKKSSSLLYILSHGEKLNCEAWKEYNQFWANETGIIGFEWTLERLTLYRKTTISN